MTTSIDTAAFEQQAHWCRQLGSPFTAALLDALVSRLDETTATGRRVIHWPGTAGPMKDVVPLRLAGAFHALVLSGKAPDLAAIYPTNPMPDTNTLAEQLITSLQSHDAEVCDFLTHTPQTNEIARATVLMAGLSVIFEQTNLPLALFEIGCSGGLNLCLDRFSLALGDHHLGDVNSPVKLAPKWTGPIPKTMPEFTSKQGCDLNPIDVADPDQAIRLLSYIWPDQPDRMARTRAAIELAKAIPPQLTKADAADWVEKIMTNTIDGKTRVLMHSIAWQYMPDAVQTRITQAMETAGAKATQTAPLAWLSFELSPTGAAELRMRLWPQNPDWHVLARSNPHVKHVDWCAPGPE